MIGMGMKDFSTAVELAPYLAEPMAMPVGMPGKVGRLYMEFECDPAGRSIMRNLYRQAPLVVQQELYFDEAMPQMPCVYILSSGGPNVDGDRYEQNFVVRKGAFCHISTGAATKLACMRYNYSALTQRFVLEDDAYVEYLPEPMIPCRNTRFVSDTAIELSPSATLFYSEIFLGGRRYYAQGEHFAYDLLSICTHAARPDGRELFRDKFLIRPHSRRIDRPGIMDDYAIFANAVVLTPAEHAAEILRSTDAFVDPRLGLAAAITRLPNGCGLLYRILGNTTTEVKRCLRSFCSKVRMQVKGHPLPEEFPWR